MLQQVSMCIYLKPWQNKPITNEFLYQKIEIAISFKSYEQTLSSLFYKVSLTPDLEVKVTDFYVKVLKDLYYLNA